MLGRLRSRGVALTACASLLLGVSACGEDADDSAETSTSAIQFYGTDGNMQNPLGEEFKDEAGLLDGMKGTTALTPLSLDFRNRLFGVNPKIGDFLYTAETYDAVVITALAAQLAGSTDPKAIAAQIVGVTNGGQPCDSPAACLELARNGVDIEYRGVSVTRGGFTELGEPSTASYATVHFDDRNRLDEGKMEFVGAGDESKASSEPPPPPKKQVGGKGDGRDGSPLKLGGLLPQSGDLKPAYPQLIAAVNLARQEINAAGGVLGDDLVFVEGDDGTSPEVAKKTLARLVREDVQVIIGAGASSVTREVLPDVVKAGKVLFSPSNTDAGLSSFPDEGLYFRTAPSDLLQARALADVILRDGPKRIAIIARKDSYGEGLQNAVRSELERVGVTTDRIRLLTYDPPKKGGPPVDFTGGAQEVKQFGADAVLVIGFFESAAVIKAIAATGVPIQH